MNQDIYQRYLKPEDTAYHVAHSCNDIGCVKDPNDANDTQG